MSELPKHVIILVHGIRDFALWQTTVRHTLERVGFDVELTNFMRLDLVRFLVPIPIFKNVVIDKVWRQIEDIRLLHPNASISIIAHSFGTYVVAEILRRQFSFKAHRIIFCGSVVRYDFPFEQIKDRFNGPIVNEVGTHDIWPALAESVTFGYGSAGTYGFRRPRVRDRWHNGKDHSAFLTETFCKTFWIPFLKEGKIVEASIPPEPAPLWIRLLYVFQLRYALPLIFAIGLWGFEMPSYRLPPLPEPVAGMDGTWSISLKCPSGANVNEPRANFVRGKYKRRFAGPNVKGTSEFVMQYEQDRDISLIGRVMFEDGIGTFDVKARGQQSGGSYLGSGVMGSESGCKLEITP